jgi:hypothetical protein
MRKALAIALAVVVFASGEAAARGGVTFVTQPQATNICKGKKNSDGKGNCAWCGKVTCTDVSCNTGRKGQCSVTIYKPKPKTPQ